MIQIINEVTKKFIDNTRSYVDKWDSFEYTAYMRGIKAWSLYLTLFLSIWNIIAPYTGWISRIAFTYTLTEIIIKLIFIGVFHYNASKENEKKKDEDEEKGFKEEIEKPIKIKKRRKLVEPVQEEQEQEKKGDEDVENGYKIHRSRTKRAQKILDITRVFVEAKEKAEQLEMETKPLVVLSKLPPSNPLTVKPINLP